MMISFGVFSDAHYSKDKTYQNRYCSQSIDKLHECINTFNDRHLEFAVNLGDIIDKSEKQSEDAENIEKVNGVLSRFTGQMHMVLGNHDLESMVKPQFLDFFGVQKPSTFYSFDMEKYHFVVMDPNYRVDGEEYNNGNYHWTDSYIPDEQKNWLSEDLSSSTNDNAIIFIHQNLDHRLWNGNIDPHIVKNAADIRNILENSGKKITVIQGHYHNGHCQTINGINYVTLRAMCEGTGMDNNAYMVVNIDDKNHIYIEGFGKQLGILLE